MTTLLLSATESTGISSSLVSSAGLVELCFLRFVVDYCWAVNSDADAAFLISTSISAVGSGFSSELFGEFRVFLPDCFLAVLVCEAEAADCDLAIAGSWVAGSCCAFDATYYCFLDC